MDSLSTRLIMLTMMQQAAIKRTMHDEHMSWKIRNDMINQSLIFPYTNFTEQQLTESLTTNETETETTDEIISDTNVTEQNLTEVAPIADEIPVTEEVSNIIPNGDINEIEEILFDNPKSVDKLYEDSFIDQSIAPDVTDKDSGQAERFPSVIQSVTSPIIDSTTNELSIDEDSNKKPRSNWEILQDLIRSRR